MYKEGYKASSKAKAKGKPKGKSKAKAKAKAPSGPGKVSGGGEVQAQNRLYTLTINKSTPNSCYKKCVFSV